ncbi:MAG: hypothetical protein Q7U06_00040, partial [Pseudomonadota bacterium]|nr:hypothetical protein [Pseudomonadota bacterium]
AAKPLDDLGVAACETPATTEMLKLRTALWRAHVDLPVTALAVLERDGAGVVVRRRYLPLGVAFLDRVDPRRGSTWFRIDQTTSMQMLPVEGEERFLVVIERRRRILDFALVKSGDLDPGKLRLGFTSPGLSGRVRSVSVCAVEIPAWSRDEYLPKAR